MKKTIELWKHEKVKTLVELEFPIYRKHEIFGDYGDTVIFTRIDGDGTAYHITRKSTLGSGAYSIELEIEKNYRFDQGSMEYHIGFGEYKSSAAEFNSTRADAVSFLYEF